MGSHVLWGHVLWGHVLWGHVLWGAEDGAEGRGANPMRGGSGEVSMRSGEEVLREAVHVWWS